jgi:hypothetical protein
VLNYLPVVSITLILLDTVNGLFTLLFLGVSLLLSFFAYRFGWRRYIRLKPTLGGPAWLWGVLMFLPNAAYFCMLTLKPSFMASELGAWAFIPALVAGVMQASMVWISSSVLKEKSLAFPWSFQRILKTIFTLYVFASGVLHFFPIGPSHVYLAPFAPTLLFEFLGGMIWGLSFETRNAMVYGAAAYLSLGILLALLALLLAVSMAVRRQFSPIKTAFMFYALSFLLMPAPVSQIEWAKKAIPISEHLERAQWKFTYPMAKYFNREEGSMFRYAIEFDQGTLRLQQNSGREFEFPTDDHTFLDMDERLKFSQPISEIGLRGWTGLEDLRCLEAGQMRVLTSESNSCSEIYWKDQLIYQSKNALSILDAAVSEDGRYLALVTFEGGAYNPDLVVMFRL